MRSSNKKEENQIQPQGLYPTQFLRIDELNKESAYVYLTKEAETIRAELVEICKNYYDNNNTLRHQFNLLRNKQLRLANLTFNPKLFGLLQYEVKDKAHDATPAFINVLNQYADLINRYEKLKDLAIKLGAFTKDEADLIESASCDPFSEFFPMYQLKYREAYQQVQNDVDNFVRRIREHSSQIGKDYGKRFVGFLSFATVTGLFSIAIPYLVPVTLLAAAAAVLDSLITGIRVLADKIKIKMAQANEPKQEKQLLQDIKNDLGKQDSPVRFRQTFFDQNPSRIRDLEEIDSAVHQRTSQLRRVK